MLWLEPVLLLCNFAIMPPREYNLRLEETFDCTQKKWECYSEKFVNKLMDNNLEFVPDIATTLFDAIQTSQRPGKGYVPTQTTVTSDNLSLRLRLDGLNKEWDLYESKEDKDS